MMVVAFAGVGFSFTLFFGGNLRDALVATLAGALIRVVIQGMERVQTNGFFINLINSLLVTLIALLAVRYQIADHSDRIIIGTLMTLVPGVAVTNAMRDIIAGDLVAGTMKGLEALLVAFGSGFGNPGWR